jgi:hypothetical protein
MKTSSITFAELRHLLLDLHFTETHDNTQWRFEHPSSDTVFLFRPYSLSEKVALHDIVATRTHLDWQGLLSAAAFDDSLAKTPA